jgi:uncharacterized protein YcbX
MQGERLQACTIGPAGLIGDRGWAVRDEQAGEIRGGKNLPKLMLCSARYVEEPGGDAIPDAEITLPGGGTFLTSDDDANDRLSAFLDREVTLWPLQPASDAEHYMRADVLDSEEKIKRFLSREDDDPAPELVGIPEELMQEVGMFTSPRGTYFDLCSLHILTTATLRKLASSNPEVTFHQRRFRPNFLIETEDDAEGFVEFGWAGKRIAIGSSQLDCIAPTIRCGMTVHEQPGLAKEPGVLRTVVQEGQHVGIYAEPAAPASVEIGDAVCVQA